MNIKESARFNYIIISIILLYWVISFLQAILGK